MSLANKSGLTDMGLMRFGGLEKKSMLCSWKLWGGTKVFGMKLGASMGLWTSEFIEGITGLIESSISFLKKAVEGVAGSVRPDDAARCSEPAEGIIRGGTEQWD